MLIAYVLEKEVTEVSHFLFNCVDCDPMNGGRITSEEKATLSTYIGVIVGIALLVGAIYFFFLAQEKQKEVTGFDPNRALPSDAILKKRLKPEQYFIVRENGTEMFFQNEFWNNDRTGIYVDIITGEPLFTSFAVESE